MNLLKAWHYFETFCNQSEAFLVSEGLAVSEKDVDIIHARTFHNSPNHV